MMEDVTPSKVAQPVAVAASGAFRSSVVCPTPCCRILAFVVPMALLTIAGCRAHTAARPAVEESAVENATAAETPSFTPDPTGDFVHYLEWHHDECCSQTCQHVEIKATFRLTLHADGRAELLLDHHHRDTLSANALSTPNDTPGPPEHYVAEKGFRWQGDARQQGDALIVTLPDGECLWPYDTEGWVMLGCPESVPPLTYACEMADPSSIELPFEPREALPAGDTVLHCTTPTPEDLDFGLLLLREPIALAHGTGIQHRVFRGSDSIEGELIRPEGPIFP